MSNKLILAINPGSTSTRIALFSGHENLFQKNIQHSVDDLAPFSKITDQYEYRKKMILDVIENFTTEIDISQIAAVVGRGGLIKPVSSGVIEMNAALINDLKNSYYGEHASNLGGLIAYDIARSLPDARAFIADPVVVDELEDIARIAGHPMFKRRSIFHALNQKAVARLYSKNVNRPYEDLNLVIAHMGGGITVGAHKKGKVIDVNNGLNGEGPFSPERSGHLPMADLVNFCFSGEYSREQILKMITGKGGLVAYLGTNSTMEVEKKMEEGDEYAKLIFDAMAYQVSKSIGEMTAVLSGEVDAILLTGGVAYSNYFCDRIKNMVSTFAPVLVYPGEDEMYALALNGLMVLNGQVNIIEYH
jgi:butyrate kinase